MPSGKELNFAWLLVLNAEMCVCGMCAREREEGREGGERERERGREWEGGRLINLVLYTHFNQQCQMIDIIEAHARYAIGHPPAIFTQSWDSDKYTHFTNNVLLSALAAKNHMCICRACHHDIDSNIGNENHILRWKKFTISKPTEFTPYPVQGCTSNADRCHYNSHQLR